MKKLKIIYFRLRKFFRTKPVTIVPVAALLFTSVYVAAEMLRANLFQSSLEHYKSSSKVEAFKDSVKDIKNAISISGGAFLCDINQEDFLAPSSNEYINMHQVANRPEKIFNIAMERLEVIDKAPNFRSPLTIIESIKKSSDDSAVVQRSLRDLRELLETDARSTYCLDLSSVLEKTYFLKQLETPEGVSAMLVGQQEGFQTIVSNVIDEIKVMVFPSDFSAQHVQIIECLNSIAKDLRNDENDYKSFSRAIEKDNLELKSVLEAIKKQTEDLQKKIDRIDLSITGIE